MLPRVSLRALLAIGPLAAGCDFFQELEDAESASTDGDSEGDSEGIDGDGGTEGSAAEPCTLSDHDRCETQDRLASCNPSTGTLTTVPCDELCGQNPNFSCVSTGGGQHACWCVVPGKQKVNSCTELETCLGKCAEPGSCTDQCFSRTTTTTVRMYGALVHCAEMTCEDTCSTSPAACGPCVAAAIGSGEGCSLERAVCDEDKNDEDW